MYHNIRGDKNDFIPNNSSLLIFKIMCKYDLQLPHLNEAIIRKPDLKNTFSP